MCGICEVNRDAKFAGGDGEAVDVVLVFVGDDDGVEGAGVFFRERHATEEFAAAQAGVDEDARAPAGDNGAVALGARREDGEADHSLRIARIGDAGVRGQGVKGSRGVKYLRGMGLCFMLSTKTIVRTRETVETHNRLRSSEVSA
jgi:hypothetical protein